MSPRAVRRKHTLGFLNCNRNRNRHVAAGVCCMFFGSGWLRLRLQLEIPHPTFLRKRRKRNLLYIYLYIYSTSHITPQPSKCTCGKSNCNRNRNHEGLFSRFAICGAPTIALQKKNIAKHLHIPNTFTNFADATPKRREAPHDDNRKRQDINLNTPSPSYTPFSHVRTWTTPTTNSARPSRSTNKKLMP